jgi:hypothetical protein
MAQTGFTPLSLYFSATATNVPLAANLVAGELAINTADGKLFYKDSSNVVQVLGTKGGVGSSSTTQVLYNSSGLVVGSANMTFNGTILTSTGFAGPLNGTVGATTANTGAFTTLSTTGAVTITGGTANGVAYLNGSKVLTTGTALVFDGSNLGLGVTPSAWSGVKAFEMTAGTSLGSNATVPLTFLNANCFYNGTNWIYKTSNFANQYIMDATEGKHKWFNAASGTAGAAITFTQAMTLDASGNLGIGTTSPTSRLEIVGTNPKLTINANDSINGRTATLSLISGSSADASSTCQIMYGSSTSTSTGTLVFVEGDATERMRLDSAGNLGIGTSSPSASAILDAQSTTKGVRMPNMTTTQKNAISSPAAGLMVFDTTLAKLCVYSGSAWQTITSI